MKVSSMQYDPLNDGISNVQLINCMGSDLTVANSARVSLNKEHDELTEGDKRLISFLARNQHITPFFHPQIQFRITAPLFVIREWYRHTIGFARNEVSLRYITEEPRFYVPNIWRGKPEQKKQGSSGIMTFSERYEYWADDTCFNAKEVYNQMIEDGVAPEQARMILPNNMYTSFIETGSLYAYARLVNLRDQPDAQEEIQLYAQAVSEVMRILFPVSWYHLVDIRDEPEVSWWNKLLSIFGRS